MRKSLWLLLFFPLASIAQKPQASLKLTGDCQKISQEADWMHFMYRSNGANIHDSVAVTKGQYSYTTTLAEPTLINIYPKYKSDAMGSEAAKGMTMDYVSLMLYSGKVQISSVDSFTNITVKGSKTQEAYKELEDVLKPFSDKQQELGQQWMAFNKEKNEAGKKEVEDKMEKLDAEETAARIDFFKKNAKSPIAAYMLNSLAGWDIKPEVIEPLMAQIPASQMSYPSMTRLKENVAIAKKTGIGMPAMEFTQNDPEGKPVSLSSFRGSYVLVDFWASWCGPCRVENPNVVKAYNKYKDKGFNILGVSLDREGQKDRWLKAIADDNLTWTHVSDLKFWNNAVAVQYGIKAIPQNILIDPQGKIVAKNLRGEDLDKKLGELIDGTKTF